MDQQHTIEILNDVLDKLQGDARFVLHSLLYGEVDIEDVMMGTRNGIGTINLTALSNRLQLPRHKVRDAWDTVREVTENYMEELYG